MKRGIGLGLMIGLAAALIMPAAASADGPKRKYSGQPKYATKYRKGPAVKGYVLVQRGGYSYIPGDVINTYGNSRTLYGGNNYYRDPSLDRQTPMGPFDHGFFFDSGIGGRNGGYSPYQN